MANYSLTINSKFQPFSFERYMQPISMYAQQYENRYKEMQQQALVAGLMGSMVDPELDKETYEALQKYNNNLQRMSDIMSTVGLPPNQRKNFLDLWKQYATDVMPIENWVKMRNADIEKQSNLYAQTNGNVVFSKNAKDTSLDYYRKGKPLNYEFSNLNAALQEASTAFATWAKTYRDTEEGRAFNDAFITYKQITGIKDSNKVITDLLENNGDQYPELKKIMTTLQDKYGVNNVNFNDLDRAKIQNTLTEGALLGMASAYDEKTTIQEDPVAKQAREDASWYNKQSWLIQNDPGKQKEALEVQALRGQLENPDDPYSTLTTWDAPIDENFDSYNDLRTKLYRSDGTLGVNYTGDLYKNKNNQFVNPLEVYEYAKKIYDESPSSNKGGYTSSNNRNAPGIYVSSNSGELSKAWNNAVIEAKTHFGVKNILSEKEYNQLKKLGYSSKSTFNDFHYLNNFNKRVDAQVKRNSASGLNMAKYDHLENYAYSGLNNRTYKIQEYDERTGKPKDEVIDSKKIFGYDDGKRKVKIENAGYDINNPKKLLVSLNNGKTYYIPLAAISLDFENVVKNQFSMYGLSLDKSTISRLDNDSKSALQQNVALELRELANNYDKVASETEKDR